MDTYNATTTAEYPSSDMEIKELRIFNYSYRKISEAVHVCIWNRDITKKQVVIFTGEDFTNLLLENEDDQYLYPNCAEMLLEENLEDCMEWLDMDEVLTAVKLSGRINFRISFFELREFMALNPELKRNEAINILVDRKTEKPHMPSLEDMRLYEEAA